MSEPEIVHPLPVQELEGWMRSLRVALLGDPTSPEAAARLHNRRRTWRPELAWGVRDRGAWVGSLAVERRTITVPGVDGATAVLPVDAVTAVSVAATHRRRGLLREMMRQAQQAAVDRGDALSALIAAEWPIYGRYGYAPAVFGARYRYFPRGAGAAPAGGPARGIRPVTVEELLPVADDLFQCTRRRHAGQLDRAGHWWARELGLDGFRPQKETGASWYLHEDDDGGPDGLVGWHATGHPDLDGSTGTADVDLLVATTDAAYRDLWAYLAGLDLVGEIALDRRPVDEPVRWLLGDGRALRQTGRVDDVWLRLLDVPAALSARGYAVDGRLVLEVDDPEGGFAAGRYLLEVRDGRATCTRTTESAHLRIQQRALAAAYLGGVRLSALAVAGGVEEVGAGSLARADLMFSTPVPPWNQTPF